MHTLEQPGQRLLGSVDTAVSTTATNLRHLVEAAIDPPHTASHVRRAQLADVLFEKAREFASESPAEGVQRLKRSVPWALTFINAYLPFAPEPEVAVDSDGEVLIEWLNGPRQVLTLSVGPDGVVSFASLVGSSRFRGRTRIGAHERLAAPLRTCLAQVTGFEGA